MKLFEFCWFVKNSDRVLRGVFNSEQNFGVSGDIISVIEEPAFFVEAVPSSTTEFCLELKKCNRILAEFCSIYQNSGG